jgi:serine/threonine protein phosphatase PrpC
MRPEIDFAGRAMQGDRENQEDFYAFEYLPNGCVLVVLADGAGGQAAGEVASQTAAEGFLDYFAQSTDEVPASLFAALQEGNRKLAQFMDGDPERRASMATTLVAAAVDGDKLNWISVGDSPLLLFRPGELFRLNADHSAAGQGATSAHSRNVLRSALVGGRIPMIDWRREAYALSPGDILIAASDGVWTLSAEEIAVCVGEHAAQDAAEIAQELLHRVKAHEKPRQDNVTVGIIKISA